MSVKVVLLLFGLKPTAEPSCCNKGARLLDALRLQICMPNLKATSGCREPCCSVSLARATFGSDDALSRSSDHAAVQMDPALLKNIHHP